MVTHFALVYIMSISMFDMPNMMLYLNIQYTVSFIKFNNLYIDQSLILIHVNQL